MRLVVTGGGTGGHLFPGLAVAKTVQEQETGAQVMFIGTSRAIDQQVLTDVDFTVVELESTGIKGKSLAAKVRSVVSQPRAVAAAYKHLKKFNADLVLGVGGYVTGPVVVAAKLLGIPTCIHEQNSVPGLANKLVGKIVDVIFTSIPCGDSFPSVTRTKCTQK